MRRPESRLELDSVRGKVPERTIGDSEERGAPPTVELLRRVRADLSDVVDRRVAVPRSDDVARLVSSPALERNQGACTRRSEFELELELPADRRPERTAVVALRAVDGRDTPLERSEDVGRNAERVAVVAVRFREVVDERSEPIDRREVLERSESPDRDADGRDTVDRVVARGIVERRVVAVRFVAEDEGDVVRRRVERCAFDRVVDVRGRVSLEVERVLGVRVD